MSTKKYTHLPHEIHGRERKVFSKQEKIQFAIVCALFILAWVIGSTSDWQTFVSLHQNM